VCGRPHDPSFRIRNWSVDAYRAFSWTAAGGMTDLGSLGGDSIASAVNDTGHVVGHSYLAGGLVAHAFSWTASDGMIDLGTLEGVSSAAVDVNDRGHVVGWSHTVDETRPHATLWLLPLNVPSALNALIDTVRSYGLPAGVTNALHVKLEAALTRWNAGGRTTVVNLLRAFTNQVEAQRSKALTDGQADELVRMAAAIVEAVNSGTQ